MHDGSEYYARIGIDIVIRHIIIFIADRINTRA